MKSKGVGKPRRSAKRRLELSSGTARLRKTWKRLPAALASTEHAGDGGSSPGLFTSAVPVILIEDNRLLLEGLSAVLSAQGLKVVATARTGVEALRHVARHRPNLVLMDATLGDRNSLHLVQAVKGVLPAIRIIVMHLLPAQEDVVDFVRAGVSGFIMKDASIDEFVSTIKTVVDGGSVLPVLVTGSLFSHVADQAVTGGKRSVKAAVRMTARERQVMTLVADGFRNGEIAARLGIPSHTVKSDVLNVVEKLALHSRLDAAEHSQQRQERDKGFGARRRAPRITKGPDDGKQSIPVLIEVESAD